MLIMNVMALVKMEAVVMPMVVELMSIITDHQFSIHNALTLFIVKMPLMITSH